MIVWQHISLSPLLLPRISVVLKTCKVCLTRGKGNTCWTPWEVHFLYTTFRSLRNFVLSSAHACDNQVHFGSCPVNLFLKGRVHLLSSPIWSVCPTDKLEGQTACQLQPHVRMSVAKQLLEEMVYIKEEVRGKEGLNTSLASCFSYVVFPTGIPDSCLPTHRTGTSQG